jgi:hypothetical protein
MNMDWDVDDEGKMELLALTGFSVVVLPQSMLALQPRCTSGSVPWGGRLQIGLSADVARELIAGLLQAAEMVGDAPGTGRLN